MAAVETTQPSTGGGMDVLPPSNMVQGTEIADIKAELPNSVTVAPRLGLGGDQEGVAVGQSFYEFLGGFTRAEEAGSTAHSAPLKPYVEQVIICLRYGSTSSDFVA